jgi:TatD DNase family protein
MDLDSNIKTLDIAGRFPGTVLPAIGYHPWRILAEDVDRNLAFIESQLSQCVALGEVGLDYKVKVKKPLQWDVFSRVLNFAVNQKKPVIVHSRFSYQRSFQMVSAAGVERAVFHWYSGPLDILEEIIHKGYYISATPALAYSRFHQAAVKKAPLERILVETDSPVAYQGKKSEPVYLIDTLKSLSLLKGMPVQKVADITTENAGRFFGC